MPASDARHTDEEEGLREEQAGSQRPELGQ